MSKQALYCDGGVCGRNPSQIGGVWAWCLVEDDAQVRTGSGLVLPAECDCGLVTNNVTELRAAVEALEAMPKGWQGTLLSDSQVTLGRIFKEWPTKGVPVDLYQRLHRIRLRLSPKLGDLRVDFVLLQGHPTRADLERGIGAKRGLPVSKWNVAMDKRCQELAAEMLNRQAVGVS